MEYVPPMVRAHYQTTYLPSTCYHPSIRDEINAKSLISPHNSTTVVLLGDIALARPPSQLARLVGHGNPGGGLGQARQATRTGPKFALEPRHSLGTKDF